MYVNHAFLNMLFCYNHIIDYYDYYAEYSEFREFFANVYSY